MIHNLKMKPKISKCYLTSDLEEEMKEWVEGFEEELRQKLKDLKPHKLADVQKQRAIGQEILIREILGEST